MKKQRLSFFAGTIAGVLLSSLTLSAIGFSGWMTIQVSPINILVDGEIFQPTDVFGGEVPVFVYNGTTYAPLRALAESYGLEVGYDAEKNLASVTSPEYTASLQKSNELSRCNIQLVKVGEEYFARNAEGPGVRPSGYYMADGLLFALDVTVSDYDNLSTGDSGRYCSAWELANVVRMAMTEEYDIDQSENPYFRYLTTDTMEWICTCRAGREETVWYAPGESYTPAWWEVNGRRLYSLDPVRAETVDGFQVQNGIRYCDGMVCVNDVLSYFGMEEEIVLGVYEGYTYFELR